MRPPKAMKKPFSIKHHQDLRRDDFYWLRDEQRSDPEVLEYLTAENQYCEHQLAPTAALQQTLYQEMTARLKPSDQSVPYFKNGYWYQQRFEPDCEFPMLVRNKQHLSAPEECLLDLNEQAEGFEYYDLAEAKVSPNQQQLAFSEDCLGRRLYQIKIKDLATGQIAEHCVDDTSGEVVWGNDSRYFYYVKKHPVTLVPYQVYRHQLGVPSSLDQLVYEEADDSFYISLHKTRSEQMIVIGAYASTTSEALYLDANNIDAQPQLFNAREKNIEYELEHFAGQFFVKTNALGKNFALIAAPEQSNHVISLPFTQWPVIVEHKSDVLLQGYELFNDFIVIEERCNGLVKLRYRHWQHQQYQCIEFNDPTYTAWLAINPEPNTSLLRFCYSSLTTPASTLEVDLTSGQQKTLKQQQVMGDFNAQDYQSERVWAVARDGVKVPVSLVYKRHLFKRHGNNPLLVYGYGAYGLSEDAMFSSDLLSLLDRGFVYAIAHVRGGEELGRQWYESGKLGNKHNSFYDFIDVTEALIKQGFGDPKRVYAMGGSAGGLLMGGVINLAPTLYHGVVAQVPFVDVLTTMLDESLPLTTGEYEEWGNPNLYQDYQRIKSYSPYDQVKAQVYPHLLVVTGLHDSQVQYWEPAKWVAKLREYKQGDTLLLLHTDLDAGHGGKSGRFKQYYDTAREYAFLLWLAEQQPLS
ncbi:S9 family peptidase [Motilimonas sp. E26]|uniref:S9 family peptidase n=1 Tax=Motilimonas sp. E26 TaxID=2865674 RepID=UPI0032B768F0